MMENTLKEWLRRQVSAPRYEHSLGVLEAASELADRYGVEKEPLRSAALIHDCARELSGEELVALALEWGLEVRDVDRESPVLLHGRVGMELARRELGIDEPAIVSAVSFHTAGHPAMSLSDKLFFLADHIEPGRRYPFVGELRAAAFAALNRAMLLAIDINHNHLSAKGAVVDPLSLELQQTLQNET